MVRTFAVAYELGLSRRSTVLRCGAMMGSDVTPIESSDHSYATEMIESQCSSMVE